MEAHLLIVLDKLHVIWMLGTPAPKHT